MEKFSNDPIENIAINALEEWWGLLQVRFNDEVLTYCPAEGDWHCPWTVMGESVKWSDAGEKEKIIDFLCIAKPDFERELLRARSEVVLSNAPLNAL